MKCLIITAGYKEYAVELTTEVATAIPALLTAQKVRYISKNEYNLTDEKSDLQLSIAEVTERAEVEYGNN